MDCNYASPFPIKIFEKKDDISKQILKFILIGDEL